MLANLQRRSKMENVIGFYYQTKGGMVNNSILECSKKFGINLTCEENFYKLVGSVINIRPDVLFLDFSNYQQNKQFLSMFKEESPFNVPFVIVVGNIEPDFLLNLPNNYRYVKSTELENVLGTFSSRYRLLKREDAFVNNLTANYGDQIFRCLVDIGFNGSTNGTQFIKDCSNEIMLNRCRPSVLSKNLYSKVANYYETTSASVARCMKVAIDTAWKKSQHEKSEPSGVTFNDFSKCPTAKEFIYYLSNKLYNYNQKNKFKHSLENMC